MSRAAGLLAIFLTLAGCQASQTYGETTAAVHRPTTAVTASSNGNGTSIATSGSGSTGSGTSEGSSGGLSGGSGSCPPASTCDPMQFDGGLNDCAPSQLELVANLINFCASGVPITCQVQASDIDNPSVMGISTGCGLFHLCFDAGTTLHMQASAGEAYWPLVFANTEPTASTVFPGNVDGQGVPLFCNGASFLGLTQLLAPAIDITKASLVAEVYPLHIGTSGCDATKAGWTFTLEDLDGGVVPAASAILVGSSIGTGTVTSDLGVEFFYNIEPSVGTVQVLGTQLDAGLLPDGGAFCPLQTEQPPFYITGTVDLVGGQFSFFPYLIL